MVDISTILLEIRKRGFPKCRRLVRPSSLAASVRVHKNGDQGSLLSPTTQPLYLHQITKTMKITETAHEQRNVRQVISSRGENKQQKPGGTFRKVAGECWATKVQARILGWLGAVEEDGRGHWEGWVGLSKGGIQGWCESPVCIWWSLIYSKDYEFSKEFKSI